MKKHYVQLYQNECGLNAIKNLLAYYHIETKLELEYFKEGTSFTAMIDCLKKYFFIVEAIEVELYEVVKLDEITPFIALVGKDNTSHYIVCLKRKGNYFLIADSLKKRKYYISFEEFEKIFLKKAIICEQCKKIIKKFDLNLFFLPFLSLIETMFLLSLTIILQQIIDSGFKEAFLYVIIELSLVIITYFKIKIYLKTYKKYDTNIVLNTLDNIYHLKESFVNKHCINDIFYNFYDAYSLKNLNLTKFFSITNDIILYLLSSIIIFKYSYVLGIIVFLISILLFVISKFINKKSFILLENKRKDELEFTSYYKDSFNFKERIYAKHDEKFYRTSLNKLKKYQKSSYNLEKFDNLKNYLLFFFQSLINCLIIMIYFTFLQNILSLGKLVATLNLTMLILQPILNITSELSNFANFKLIKQRIKNLKENITNNF